MLFNKMRTLGESQVSGVNQGNEGGRWLEDFLVLPQRLWTSRQLFRERRGIFRARGVFVSDYANGGWFLLEL